MWHDDREVVYKDAFILLLKNDIGRLESDWVLITTCIAFSDVGVSICESNRKTVFFVNVPDRIEALKRDFLTSLKRI